jgi:hypothetical protein
MICTKTSVSFSALMIGLACACNTVDFTAAHFSELEKDCFETQRCNSGGANADELQKCIDEGGAKLQKSSTLRQQTFVDAVNRCVTLTFCDYLGCTQSDPNTGYAAAHRQQIINDCQQTIGCRIASNQPQSMTAVDECIAQRASMLNVGTQQAQQAFELKVMKCVGQLNCAWVNCM